MNSIGTIIGVLAILIALAAVFFSSLAMKKADESSQEFIRLHVDPLHAQLSELKTLINATRAVTETLRKDVDGVSGLRTEVEGMLSHLEAKVDQMAAAQSAAARVKADS